MFDNKLISIFYVFVILLLCFISPAHLFAQETPSTKPAGVGVVLQESGFGEKGISEISEVKGNNKLNHCHYFAIGFSIGAWLMIIFYAISIHDILSVILIVSIGTISFIIGQMVG